MRRFLPPQAMKNDSAHQIWFNISFFKLLFFPLNEKFINRKKNYHQIITILVFFLEKEKGVSGKKPLSR